MDVVFMGTPEFAVPSLERLADTHDVVGVYTRPDAVSRRGKTLVAPPVKSAAELRGLPVMQPVSLRDETEISRLRSIAPDVICVAAFGMILPREVLEIPRFGCINVHASLLPRHRGAAPVHRAVLEGDEVIGVSIMRMEEGLDTGPFAIQRSMSVDDLDVPTLTAALAVMGADALLDVLAEIDAGTVVWVAQDASRATYAAKVTAEDVSLDPGLTAREALLRVRASTPQAPARLQIGDTVVTVLRASGAAEAIPPGGVGFERQGLFLGFADGTLSLDRIRPAGRGDMDGAAWVCGARLPEHCRWQASS